MAIDTYELFLLATIFNSDIRFAVFRKDLEREVLEV